LLVSCLVDGKLLGHGISLSDQLYLEYAFCRQLDSSSLRLCLPLVLALSTGMPFWFDVPLTIVSAVVAITASFLALGSGLIMDVLRRRQFRRFLPLNVGSPGSEAAYDDESIVDMFARSSFSDTGEFNTSSAEAELEALLSRPQEQDLLEDSWANNHLVTRVLWTFWYSCTLDRVLRGFGLGLVFITMHYTGSMLIKYIH